MVIVFLMSTQNYGLKIGHVFSPIINGSTMGSQMFFGFFCNFFLLKLGQFIWENHIFRSISNCCKVSDLNMIYTMTTSNKLLFSYLQNSNMTIPSSFYHQKFFNALFNK